MYDMEILLHFQPLNHISQSIKQLGGPSAGVTI